MIPNNNLLDIKPIDNLIFNNDQVLLHGRDGFQGFATYQHAVLYFMCRLTCSRCWKGAVMLGNIFQRFLDHKMIVILIGDGCYFQPAKKLARSIGLPFPLLVDKKNVLRKHLDLNTTGKGCHENAAGLIDKYGRVCYRYRGCSPEEILTDIGEWLYLVG